MSGSALPIVLWIIVGLQSIVVLALIVLLLRRVLIGYWEKHTQARKNHFEPIVLGLLEDPRNIDALERGLRPFDRSLTEELLLQQAAELRGQERSEMATVFERLGYVREEKKRLESRTWWRRHDAAIKLGIMGSEESIPDLTRAVNDASEEVRLAAVRALGQMNYPEGVKVLLDVMQDRENWSGARVLEVLAGSGSSVKEEVLSRLQSNIEPRSRLLLIQLCGVMRWTEAAPLLIPLIDDADAETRISTARALGSIGDATVARHLVRALRDPRWEVRAQAAKSLGLLQDSGALVPLAQSLYDSHWWVRYNAANSLYQLGEQGVNALQETRSHANTIASGMAAQVLAERELGV